MVRLRGCFPFALWAFLGIAINPSLVILRTSGIALVCFLPVVGADGGAECEAGEDGSCIVQEEEGEKKQEESVFDLFGKWVDDVKEKGTKFFNDLDQSGAKTESTEQADEQPVTKQKKNDFGLDGLTKMFNNAFLGEQLSEEAVDRLVDKARDFSGDVKAKSFDEVYKLFSGAFQDVKDAMDRHFGHIDLSKFNLASLFYFLELEDAKKNPSWKRRKHRFFRGIDHSQVYDLHDALYLSDLSYVDNVEQVQAGLNTTKTKWELIYCQTESAPGEPAHFIAVKRETQNQQWQPLIDAIFDGSALEVLLVVRGTKEIGDFLSDALLDASAYRGGNAHAGIVAAGKYLVDKHLELMKTCLELSKKTKIKLTLVGHSLGAGSASIAAIEFNDHDFIEASVIGFGCPALLSKELSESTKGYITTVISDSDVVPRMSGATVANAVLDIMAHDFSDQALRDVKELQNVVQANSPIEIPQNHFDSMLNFVNTTLAKTLKPFITDLTTERIEQVLIPPGTCVHFFRDGVGVSGSYTPCDFFNEVDITRTMIEDHYTVPGYHRILLDLMRSYTNDLNFQFHHAEMTAV